MLITSCLLRLALIMLLFGIPVLEVVACGRTRRQGEEKSMLRDSGTHMLHRGLARRGWNRGSIGVESRCICMAYVRRV